MQQKALLQVNKWTLLRITTGSNSSKHSIIVSCSYFVTNMYQLLLTRIIEKDIKDTGVWNEDRINILARKLITFGFCNRTHRLLMKDHTNWPVHLRKYWILCKRTDTRTKKQVKFVKRDFVIIKQARNHDPPLRRQTYE